MWARANITASLSDLEGVRDSVDLAAFNGLALRRGLKSITFAEVKDGRSRLSNVERSIQEAGENWKVDF